MRHLIAIMTCHRPANAAKAQAQRETWVQAVRAHADVVFFLGRAANRRAAFSCDQVILDVPDDYAGIPLKVQAICDWAAQHGYDYVSKVDDDVYIAPRRWPYLPVAPFDYVGMFTGPFGGYPAEFASGFCYHLSRKAAALVAAQAWNHDWVDERFVANTLAHKGIFGHADDSDHYRITGPHLSPATVAGHISLRQGIVFCEYGPDDIRGMHTHFANAEMVRIPQPLCPVARVACTKQQLMARPLDQMPEHKNAY